MGGNRDIDFAGKAITVRSTDPQDQAVVAATIIDFEYQGRGFYFVTSEGANSVLDGLTITNAGDGSYNSDASYDKEIGRMAYLGGIQFFDGKIDDVKIFERVLSEAQILQLATDF